MSAEGVSVAEVENAVRAQNVDLPSGRIEGTAREFTVFTESDFESWASTQVYVW